MQDAVSTIASDGKFIEGDSISDLGMSNFIAP
jgi:hypothetical protein